MSQKLYEMGADKLYFTTHEHGEDLHQTREPVLVSREVMLRKCVPDQTSCPPPLPRPDSLRAVPVGHISSPSLRPNVFPRGVSQSLRWVFLAHMSAALTSPLPGTKHRTRRRRSRATRRSRVRLTPKTPLAPTSSPYMANVAWILWLSFVHSHTSTIRVLGSSRTCVCLQEKSTPPEECRSAGLGSVLGHPAWGVPGRCFRTWGE